MEEKDRVTLLKIERILRQASLIVSELTKLEAGAWRNGKFDLAEDLVTEAYEALIAMERRIKVKAQ